MKVLKGGPGETAAASFCIRRVLHRGRNAQIDDEFASPRPSNVLTAIAQGAAESTRSRSLGYARLGARGSWKPKNPRPWLGHIANADRSDLRQRRSIKYLPARRKIGIVSACCRTSRAC